MFCSNVESVDHLFFTCPVARFLWGIVRCAFAFRTVPVKFDSLPSWLVIFPVKDTVLILVGVAELIWAIWKTQNNACFNGVILQDLTSIVFLIAHFISYCAGLQKTSLQSTQSRRAKLLVLVATEIFHRRHAWGPLVLRLTET